MVSSAVIKGSPFVVLHSNYVHTKMHQDFYNISLCGWKLTRVKLWRQDYQPFYFSKGIDDIFILYKSWWDYNLFFCKVGLQFSLQ